MVKLQKHKAYVYQTESGETIEHYKHLVNIPEEAVEKLGWRQGMELEPVVEGASLVLKPTQKSDNLVKENGAKHLKHLDKKK